MCVVEIIRNVLPINACKIQESGMFTGPPQLNFVNFCHPNRPYAVLPYSLASLCRVPLSLTLAVSVITQSVEGRLPVVLDCEKDGTRDFQVRVN
jgi:hypothetical protein